MMGPFIALGNCLAYREAVISGTPVSAAAYTEASAFAMQQVTKVNNIIHQGDLGSFREPPSIWRLLYPEVSLSPGSKRGVQVATVSDDSTAISDLSSPTPRKGKKPAAGKSTASQSPDLSARKAKGVMKFGAQGKPPVPTTRFSHPISGKMTYLCGNASTVGYSCPRTQDDCNFAHVHFPLALKRPEDCNTLRAFFTNHADSSLARPGMS